MIKKPENFFIVAHVRGGRNYVTGDRDGYHSREQAVESIRKIYHSGFFGENIMSVSVHAGHPAYKTSKMLIIASPVTFWNRSAA